MHVCLLTYDLIYYIFTDTLDSTGEATAETSEPVNVRILLVL